MLATATVSSSTTTTTSSYPQFWWASEDPIIFGHNQNQNQNQNLTTTANLQMSYFETLLTSSPTSSPSFDTINNNNIPNNNNNNNNEPLLMFDDDEDDEENDDEKAKKLNHNASERDRRRRINSLYSSLRSLLPPQHHSKKLSIPATVSKVLKYIPELQKQVENLIRQKETLISRISGHETNPTAARKVPIQPSSSSSSAVSATQINPNEIIVQTSMPKSETNPFSETVKGFEDLGFLLINASSFESSASNRVFFNLHLQAQENQVIDAEMLKEKVLAFSHIIQV
ncbi:transcription factor ORG3-like [Andrographis paniculata]|uniref:transcription factor ORG3-like n=1 Tax=Andrographis paniculata TaxID=175694 RepID=UPI0021E7BF08|nr:transcription factor ORG3-like [Andrographis paniculata]